MNTLQDTPKIVIPMEDPIIHTPERPWCADSTCPCHTSTEGSSLRSTELWRPYQNGLATWDETLRRFYDRQAQEQEDVGASFLYWSTDS